MFKIFLLLWNIRPSTVKKWKRFHNWNGILWWYLTTVMMTSSNGNIFRVTGPLCGEFIVPSEFPSQTPATRSFDVFFDLRLNKRLSKHSRSWWFETSSHSLWCQCDGLHTDKIYIKLAFYCNHASFIAITDEHIAFLDIHWHVIPVHLMITYFAEWLNIW